MKVEARHVLASGASVPIIQGHLQRMPKDWCPICMVCGDVWEIMQPLRESLVAVSSAVVFCPKCNSGHVVVDGTHALVMGPADGAAPERPEGLVLGRVVTPDILGTEVKTDRPGDPLHDTRVLTPGDYLAINSPPQKPLRRDGLTAPCCTCGGKTDLYCPDCERPLCLKPGCEASHAVSCKPQKRDSYL
jgi:hypothetical protein